MQFHGKVSKIFPLILKDLWSNTVLCFKSSNKVGIQDVWLGEVYGCDFFMSRDQFEYWKHTQLTLDDTPGRGSSFSIEIPMGIRFMIRSKLFTTEELEKLSPVMTGEEKLSEH